MTYAEYLRSQGATDADIQVLDTPLGRKAFDAQQAAITAANTERDTARQTVTDTENWFNDVQTPEWNKLNSDVIAAKAEAARFKAALRTAQDRGLLNITKDLGLDDNGTPVTPSTPTTPTTPVGFDASKYLTVEQATKLMNDVGGNLAALEDMVMEHQQLFGSDPSKRLNVTALRTEALQHNKNVRAWWEEKYKVSEAREKQIRDAQAAHDKKVGDDRVAAARAEWAKEYGSNPDQRIHMPSSSSITVRKNTDGTTTQPWARGEDEASNDRVRRALERQRQRESGQTVN